MKITPLEVAKVGLQLDASKRFGNSAGNVLKFMRMAGHCAVVEEMRAHPEEEHISFCGMQSLLTFLTARVERDLGNGGAVEAWDRVDLERARGPRVHRKQREFACAVPRPSGQ